MNAPPIKRPRGRPALGPEDKKIQIALKLPPYILAWLDTHEGSRADLIEQALNYTFEIKKSK